MITLSAIRDPIYASLRVNPDSKESCNQSVCSRNPNCRAQVEDKNMEMVRYLTKKSNGITSLAKMMACNVSGAAVSATDYLRTRGLRRMGRDLSKCVTKNPVQSMVALTALGFFTGMLVRRR